MKKIEDVKIEVYDTGYGIVLEIKETEDRYEAYFSKRDSAEKTYLFEKPKYYQTKQEFLDIVETYIDGYVGAFEDEVTSDGEGCSQIVQWPIDGGYCPFE